MFRDCRAPAEGTNTLLETGLYCNAAPSTLANKVRPYSAKFQLWTDGAAKSRWVLSPDGQSIDTSDMDEWRLPIGAKLWKEFSSEGKRIETRLMTRVGPADDDWTFQSFAWNESQDDAFDTLGEEVTDALGTSHDIPAGSSCEGCHATTNARALGFSAIQLDNQSILEQEVTLQALIDE